MGFELDANLTPNESEGSGDRLHDLLSGSPFISGVAFNKMFKERTMDDPLLIGIVGSVHYAFEPLGEDQFRYVGKEQSPRIISDEPVAVPYAGQKR